MTTHAPHEDILCHYAEASALLASTRDIIDERPDGEAVPSWVTRREWREFLASLTDDEVDHAEREGLAAALPSMPRAPASLASLGHHVAAVTAVPIASRAAARGVESRRASPRKREQVAAFAAIAREVSAGLRRVVDVGSGHGHLTRHLAAELSMPAEGWERDAARVAVASSLVDDGSARFVVGDARDALATITRDDLVVGLHACGALGDHAVRAASDVGASVVLVGCCLQKREGARAPLTAVAGVDASALTIGRPVLGLGNACDGDEGVEDDRATRVAARVHRVALRAMLAEANALTAPGEEMRGINRRRATGDFASLAALAFSSRGMEVPTRESTERALRRALLGYERTRRWTLPRMMLARLVEVWVALDRASLLASRGYEARVCAAFESRVSPRNLAVIGAPR